MSKKKKIEINFCGNSAQDVTGSMIHIKTPDREILIECGLVQSAKNSTLDLYKTNSAHLPFSPKNLDYVFVLHNHADHLCGSPRLYQKGCNCPLIMPEGSYDIAEILLKDSANIMRCDAEEISAKFSRNYAPIYDEDDVNNCLRHQVEYPIGEIITLDEYVKFRFVPSGHILNSCQLELWITNGNIVEKILYTSDLGNIHIKKYYTNNFEAVNKADIVIGESTYARQPKIANEKMRTKDLEKLRVSITQTCIEECGRVMIPVFSNDRGQNVLTLLYDMFGKDPNFQIPIICDSPMFTKCCEAYSKNLEDEELEKWKEVLSWSNVHFTSDYIESRELRESLKPMVILASSGMIVGRGRSVGWACSMVPRKQDRIVFCGYSAEGSIGYILKEGKQKTITISGKRCANKCQVTNLLSFSSHMQRDSLLEYYSSIQCEKVILVHGEMNSKIEFAKELQEEISRHDNTGKAIVANKGYKLTL